MLASPSTGPSGPRPELGYDKEVNSSLIVMGDSVPDKSLVMHLCLREQDPLKELKTV